MPAQSATQQFLQPRPPAQWGAALRLQVWQPWYDGIIDWYLTHPGGKIKDCAADLGRSYPWVQQIIRTDSFQSRLATRRAEFNAELAAGVSQKLGQVAFEALDILLVQLQSKRTNVPIDKVVDIADKALERLGYGIKPPGPAPGVQVQINNHPTIAVAPAEAIRDARAKLREIEATKLNNERSERTQPPPETFSRSERTIPGETPEPSVEGVSIDSRLAAPELLAPSETT